MKLKTQFLNENPILVLNNLQWLDKGKDRYIM